MPHRPIVATLAVAAVLAIAGGCADDDTDGTIDDDTADGTADDDTDGTTDDTGSTTAPAGPPAGFDTTAYPVGTIDPGLAPFSRRAIADLAPRLGVATDDIEVLTAVLVVWPTAALGCPEPDREYAQVPTDGAVIELGHGDRVYRYHAGGTEGPFSCDVELDPVPEAILPP